MSIVSSCIWPCNSHRYPRGGLRVFKIDEVFRESLHMHALLPFMNKKARFVKGKSSQSWFLQVYENKAKENMVQETT